MKSYITKFNDTKGDYVIVEKTEEKRPVEQKRGLFNIISSGLFRRRDEHVLSSGLNILDNSAPITQPTVPNNTAEPNNSATEPSNVGNNNGALPSQNGAIGVNNSLPLFSELYAKFRILNNIYQVLSGINSDFALIFNDFISDNTALMGGILNIYRSLSGQNNMPQVNVFNPAMPSRASDILTIVANYIQDMRKLNYQLLNLFEVENIDRQLNLIDTALSIQADAVTNLRLA